jgi:hypothetical protein
VQGERNKDDSRFDFQFKYERASLVGTRALGSNMGVRVGVRDCDTHCELLQMSLDGECDHVGQELHCLMGSYIMEDIVLFNRRLYRSSLPLRAQILSCTYHNASIDIPAGVVLFGSEGDSKTLI